MASRGRYSQSHDWDPMKEDYDNTYDTQYLDDDAGGGVQLDHCKLYITNITKAINEEGLRSAFAAYGTLLKVYLSKDPFKRYAIVTYETPNEAKIAMMKLNRTEPLRLNINIAHKKNNQNAQSRERKGNKYCAEPISHQNGSGSVSSKGRNGVKHGDSNGANECDAVQHEDNVDFEEDLDADIDMIEQLQLEYLKIQEEEIQCRKRMLLRKIQKTTQKPSTNRCILPDGRIVVRNSVDRANEPSSFNSAAGDSSVPALQRMGSRLCIACGAPADAYCARCGIAPYCGARCQQKDWTHRHRAVCHNLARLNAASRDAREKEIEPKLVAASRDSKEKEIESVANPPAPLRRPRSPVQATRDASERAKKNLYPAGQNNTQQAGTSHKNHRGGQSFKNQSLRRPVIKRGDGNDDDEETLEPKVESKPVPEPPSPKPAVTKTTENPSDNIYRARVKQSPVKKELGVTKVDSVPEVKKTLPPGTVADATPVRKIIPKEYLIETLPVGETVLLSVDAKASDCASKSGGYVCLSLHESGEENYKLLCDDYSVACETAADCKPNPGEVFSYRNPEDGAYYRARCLNSTSAALIDSSKLVSITADDECRSIAPNFEAIAEFCCIVDAPNIKIGDNLKCTLKSKSADVYKVHVENAETGASIGQGEISRWRPLVECPVPKPLPAALVIPEVPRPDVKNNSTVLLVEALSLDRVLVRPSDVDSIRMFDAVLYDVIQLGLKASPVKKPPQKGETVIGKFSDGNCYRALCRRTNVQQNKYQLEYIEFGNIEVNTRETIYPCPQDLDLSSKPTLVSLVKLNLNTKGLTAAATEYIEKLRDTSTELVLTLPDGASSAASGAEVSLIIAKNRESVNKKIELMCTPDWKKIEDRGGDVVEVQPLMINAVKYMELPDGPCEIEVSDVSMLRNGAVCGCRRLPGTAAALEALTKQMEEYCNSELGRKPYLPKLEELCIAQMPPYPQWFRAVLCEQVGGAGGTEVRLCYIDYGNVETVPVTVLRKMLPEFVHGQPALASHLEIRGFPEDPNDFMLAKALQHMKIDEEGRGLLKVTRCEKMDPGLYVVDAPELLKAIGLQ